MKPRFVFTFLHGPFDGRVLDTEKLPPREEEALVELAKCLNDFALASTSDPAVNLRRVRIASRYLEEKLHLTVPHSMRGTDLDFDLIEFSKTTHNTRVILRFVGNPAGDGDVPCLHLQAGADSGAPGKSQDQPLPARVILEFKGDPFHGSRIDSAEVALRWLPCARAIGGKLLEQFGQEPCPGKDAPSLL